MQTSIPVREFLDLNGVILDVRSPSEFHHAHIPSAVNLPLFSDAERATIGTAYKQLGHRAAVEEGFKAVGPKLGELVAVAQNLLKGRLAKVHCWRGGMRSQSVAWLLGMLDLQTVTLRGGYKSFRQHIKALLDTMSGILKGVVVLGGFTGSGKTSILEILERRGEQVLNLEALAQHRGSSYGILGSGSQPSNEQFENTIALKWSTFDTQRTIWVEDESRLIGRCQIPDPLFRLIGQAPVIVLDRPKDERIAHLADLYGQVDPAQLIQATQRINKRLGGLRTSQAIDYIKCGALEKAIELVLEYYDKTYRFALERRLKKTISVSGHGLSEEEWGTRLLQIADQLNV